MTVTQRNPLPHRRFRG